MTLTNPSLILIFDETLPSGSHPVKTVQKQYIVNHSVRIRRQILNGLRSSSNQATLQLTQKCPYIADIIASDFNIGAVLMDAYEQVFTGYLSTNWSWSVTANGEQNLNVTIEDVGTRKLNRPFIQSGRHLLDCTVDEAVCAICSSCGIPVYENRIRITAHVTKVIEASDTCRSILEQMLYESGYAYFFDSQGQLRIFEIDCTGTSGIPVLDNDDLVITGGKAINLSKDIRQYRSARVSFSEIGRASGYLIYSNSTGRDSDHPHCNLTLPAGSHFDGTEIYTQQEWALETADEFREPAMIEACNAASETETVGSGKIIAVSNVRQDVEGGTGLTCSISAAGGPYITIDAHNSAASDRDFSKLDAYADIIYQKSTQVVRTGTEGTDSTLDDELSFIHDRETASRHANLLCDFYRYCSAKYTFQSRMDIPCGSLVHLTDNSFSGLSVDVMVIARLDSDATSVIQYSAIGISQFHLDRDTFHRRSENASVYRKGEKGEQGNPGTPGAPGQPGSPGTGGTVTTQYALMVGSVVPADSDFTDSRPSGWYVGCTYWIRLKTSWDDETETFSQPKIDTSANEVMQSLATFSIACSYSTYEKDLRSSDPVTIVFRAVSSHYLGPVYTWEINGTLYSGSVVTLNYTKATVPDSISASCTLASIVGNQVYSSQASGLNAKAVDITRYNMNLGILTSAPSGSFIDGDSYVLQSNGDYLPYVRSSGFWVQIEDVSYWPEQIAQIRDVVLANGINVPRTSAVLYAYIGNLSAQQAQIDKLATSQIELQSGGEIRSENYAEDASGNPTAGFRIDHNGNSAFVGSKVVNSVVSGSFTSRPLETQEETAGSSITGVFSSTEEFNDHDVYNAIAGHLSTAEITNLNSGTRTYGSSVISKVLKLTDDSQRTLRRTSDQTSGITGSTILSSRIPVPCTNCSVWGTPFRKRISTLAYDAVRTARLQYSLDGKSWIDFSESARGISRNSGQNIYVSQEIDTSPVNIGQKTAWNNRSLPSNCDVILATDDMILVAGGTSNSGSIHRSTDGGVSWTLVHTIQGQITGLAYGNGVYIASSADVGLFRSTDGITWTNVSPHGLGWHGVYVAFGNDRFRTSGASGNIRYAYESTDGLTWTSISGEYLSGHVAYGNGAWVHTRSSHKHISFISDMFITVEDHGNGTVQTSSDGSNWTTKSTISSLYVSSRIIFARDSWFIFRQSQDGNTKDILSSTDLVTWTSVTEVSAKTPGCCYFSGKIFFIGSGIQMNCYYARYTSSDWTLFETGSLGIGYDYSSYPLGINLLDQSNAILATITDDNTVWRTSKTTISVWSVNPAPYCRLSAFMQNGAQISLFDARRYTPNTMFRIVLTKYGGSSVNLVSPSSGSYQYNVKWNGSIFTVMLNGATVASFGLNDRFAATRQLEFTPVGQLDAILVKDVLPKEDSAYSLGALGNEFASAFIDLIYGHLVGMADRAEKLGLNDLTYIKSQLNEMNFQNMDIVRFGYRTYGGDSHVQSWVFNEGQAAGSHAYFDYCHGAVFN